MRVSTHLRRLADYVGAHTSPATREHELDRATQRVVGCLAVLLVLALDALFSDHGDISARILFAATVAYVGVTAFYVVSLRLNQAPSIAPIYLFLFADPLVLMLVLFLAPRIFAFLNPFLFVVIVRTGIRYGVRTMYLSWTATLVGSAALFASDFWRDRVELTLTFFLMLTLVPTFFSSLIRRVHGARA